MLPAEPDGDTPSLPPINIQHKTNRFDEVEST